MPHRPGRCTGPRSRRSCYGSSIRKMAFYHVSSKPCITFRRLCLTMSPGGQSMEASEVQKSVAAVAADFAKDRASRQLRRSLEQNDFKRLADAGFLLTGVPAEMGGLWMDTQKSTRPVCEILRTLARGDASVALVSSMHPAVLCLWLCQEEVP